MEWERDLTIDSGWAKKIDLKWQGDDCVSAEYFLNETNECGLEENKMNADLHLICCCCSF